MITRDSTVQTRLSEDMSDPEKLLLEGGRDHSRVHTNLTELNLIVCVSGGLKKNLFSATENARSV